MSSSFKLLIGFLIASAAVPSLATTRPTIPYVHSWSMAQASSAQNTEDDVYKIGGDVSAPILVHSVEPKFPKEARNAHLSAQVLVNLHVDTDGNPIDVRTTRVTPIDKKGHPTSASIDPRIEKGLSEKATEAVEKYKFKPSTKDGKPVKVELNVLINFQIF
jgi:periplasmic protein TonB